MSETADPVSAIEDMYAAYLVGDRDRLEANLDDTCTLWDAGQPGLITKAELQQLRRDHPPSGAQPEALDISDVRVRELPGGARLVVLTHVVTGRFPAAAALPPERLRVSSVLQFTDRWRILHHHEEPEATRT